MVKKQTGKLEEKMRVKHIVQYLSSSVLALGMVIGLISPVFAAAPSAEEPPQRTITVTGEGTIALDVDMASISIGVQSEDKEAAKAVAANTAQAKQVLERLKQAGIEDKDIQTSNFTVYPRQQYDPDGKPTETTYIVENTVFVKVRSLDKIGEILDSVIKAGANNIHSIQFDVADKAGAYQKALEAALQDARVKAEVVAKASNVKLGPVFSVQVVGGSVPISYGRGMLQAAPAADSKVPIAGGQTEITASVTVVYLIGG